MGVKKVIKLPWVRCGAAVITICCLIGPLAICGVGYFISWIQPASLKTSYAGQGDDKTEVTIGNHGPAGFEFKVTNGNDGSIIIITYSENTQTGYQVLQITRFGGKISYQSHSWSRVNNGVIMACCPPGSDTAVVAASQQVAKRCFIQSKAIHESLLENGHWDGQKAIKLQKTMLGPFLPWLKK